MQTITQKAKKSIDAMYKIRIDMQSKLGKCYMTEVAPFVKVLHKTMKATATTNPFEAASTPAVLRKCQEDRVLYKMIICAALDITESGFKRKELKVVEA